MIVVTQKCEACGQPYHYQQSGFGATKYNHKLYCPDCMKKILPVLEGIKPVYGDSYIDSTAYTLAELNAEYEHPTTPIDNPYGLRIVQVFPQLYNHDLSVWFTTRQVKMPNGKTYRWSYWMDNRQEPSITVQKIGYFDGRKSDHFEEE